MTKEIRMRDSSGFDQYPKQMYTPQACDSFGFINEAVLCQLKFLITTTKAPFCKKLPRCKDSYGNTIINAKWVRAPISLLHKYDFSFLSKNGLQRIMRRLCNHKLVLKTQALNSKGYDMTNWYTLNFNKIEEVFKNSRDARHNHLTGANEKAGSRKPQKCGIECQNKYSNTTESRHAIQPKVVPPYNRKLFTSKQRTVTEDSAQQSSNRKSDRKLAQSSELGQLGQRIADDLVTSFETYYSSDSRIHWLEKDIVEWLKQYPSTQVMHAVQDTIFNHMTNRPVHCPHCYIAKVLKMRYAKQLARRQHYQRVKAKVDKEKLRQKKAEQKQQWEAWNPKAVVEAQTNHAVAMLKKKGEIK